MSRQRPIALAGLSATEQILLEGAFFQSGGNQIPGAFQVHDPARAELVIANADDVVSLRALQAMGLSGRVLLLGDTDAGTGWPVVARPLRLHAVLEAARRVLAPPAQAATGADDAEPAARLGGWMRRFNPEPVGFAATLPFMPSDAAGVSGFEATRQFAASRVPQFEATQPFVMPGRAPLRNPAPPRRPEPGQAGKAPEALGPARSGRHGDDDFQATQQFTGGVPSVAPSGWEQEQVDWELQQAVRAAAEARRKPVSDDRVAAPTPPAAAPAIPAGHDAPRDAVVPTVPVRKDRILIVGQPGTAAGGLLRILKSVGFAADFVSSDAAVFQHLAQQPYGFVFLIEVSLGPHAIELCRKIQDHRGVSSPDLRTVIVAGHRGLFSRLRAWFAGCHAWMAIPLEKVALLQYLLLYGAQEDVPD